MSTKPLLLLLGVGPRIGSAVAKQFARQGYEVAVASRSGNNKRTEDGYFFIKADFSHSSSVPATFEAANAEFGVAPSVVVYNAYSLTPPPKEDELFSISTDVFATDMVVNTVSAYAAAAEAVRGWESLPRDARKTFIYTGNVQNVQQLSLPFAATIGAGKAASASWIGSADSMYSRKGFRFFYADQRNDDGAMIGADVDGDAHAEFYSTLAANGEKIPWNATFVKSKGYVKFE